MSTSPLPQESSKEYLLRLRKEYSPCEGTYLNSGSKTKKPYVRVCAGKQRGEYVHTLIMEGMIGRPLKPWEQVEHQDGDGTNNSWTNLMLTTDEKHPALTRERLEKERLNAPAQ